MIRNINVLSTATEVLPAGFNYKEIRLQNLSGVKMYIGLDGLGTVTGPSGAYPGLELPGGAILNNAERFLPTQYPCPAIHAIHESSGAKVLEVRHQLGELFFATLSCENISASAATTTLFTLPPNCGIIEVEFDRESAADAGITVDIGIAGDGARYVSAASLATTGKLLLDSLSKISESASADTTVYIKKSGATTKGYTTIRVRLAVRA